MENLKKDIILNDLQKTKKDEGFNDFHEKFSIGTLKLLQTFGPEQKEDSSFILAAVRGLYQNNLAALKTKSFSGNSLNNNKQALSPEKLKILNDLYERRLSALESGDKRKKLFSKHIKNAIASINKKTK